jgi:hypothetical protein
MMNKTADLTELWEHTIAEDENAAAADWEPHMIWERHAVAKITPKRYLYDTGTVHDTDDDARRPNDNGSGAVLSTTSLNDHSGPLLAVWPQQ